MDETTDTTGADALISDLRSVLDRLETAHGTKKHEQDDEEAKDEPFGGKNLKEAEREAYIRVRAHNRRRKAADSTD